MSNGTHFNMYCLNLAMEVRDEKSNYSSNNRVEAFDKALRWSQP